MEIEQNETFFEKVKSNLKDLFCETWDSILESIGEWFSAW